MEADNKSLEPIQTLAEYKAALRQVELLWYAEPDTQESQLLEDTVRRVDEYESVHTPIEPPISNGENKSIPGRKK